MKKVLGIKLHHKDTYGNTRLSAVDWWRIVNPYSHLAKNSDYELTFKNKAVDEERGEDVSWTEIGNTYDYLVSSYMDTPRAFSYLMAIAERTGLKVIMDLDDNIFDIDEMNPARIRYNENNEAYHRALKIISAVPVMTTSTKHLAQEVARFRQGPIYVAPNYIDPRVYRYDPDKVPTDDKIVIMYQGSSTHYSDLMKTGVLEAIRRLMSKYDNLEFNVAGCLIDEIKNYVPDDRIEFISGRADHSDWVKLWQEIRADIGIAPLTNTRFNCSKSSIKYYEYSLRKIPGVYSWVDPYLQVVKENETGFLAKDEEEWYEKLSWLVENEVLRRKMADSARQDVLDNYTIQKHWKIWEGILGDI